MARREFPRSIKVAVIKRATRDGVVYCEGSGCGLPAKKWQIDHIRPDGLLGEPTIENAQLLCDVCYGVKNPKDTTAIARAKRREAKAIGAVTPPAHPIKSRGFEAPEKERKCADPFPNLPRRVCGVIVKG